MAKPPRAWRTWSRRLRGAVRREGVELVVADRTEEDGVGVEREIEGRGGERGAMRGDGYSAKEAGSRGEVVAASSATALRMLTASWVTSGPMPSPARMAILRRIY